MKLFSLIQGGSQLEQDCLVVVIQLISVNPRDDLLEVRVILHRCSHCPEPGHIPKFIAEVSSLLNPFLGEADILSLRSYAHYTVAQSIRSVLGNQVERIR